MLKVVFYPQARKELAASPVKFQKRIVAELERLEKCTHPLQHQQVKKLSGKRKSDFRLRVGNYRVQFTLRSVHSVFVTHVQHRQAGY